MRSPGWENSNLYLPPSNLQVQSILWKNITMKNMREYVFIFLYVHNAAEQKVQSSKIVCSKNLRQWDSAKQTVE